MQKNCFLLCLYDTFIEDACGLKKNTSTVKDLLTLMLNAFKNDYLTTILKKK